MVISALVYNFLVKQVLIDQRSSTDILYSQVAKALGISKSPYKPYKGMLVSFTRGQVQVEDIVAFQMTLGSQPCVKTMEVNFLMVSAHDNTYNAILGRPSLNRIEVIISTPHLLMKFLIGQGIGQVGAN